MSSRQRAWISQPTIISIGATVALREPLSEHHLITLGTCPVEETLPEVLILLKRELSLIKALGH